MLSPWLPDGYAALIAEFMTLSDDVDGVVPNTILLIIYNPSPLGPVHP
jgi:hypothetical protein